MPAHVNLLTAAAVAMASLPVSLAAQSSSSVARTREVLETYWKNHDPKYVAEDAVFTMLPTGEEIRGRDAIAKHLESFYHGSFTAHAEVVSSIFSENRGLLEALVIGKHTGEFGGIPATGKDVRVPLAVSYELENGLIKRARIYLMANVLFDQIKPAGTH
jgi:hypothetical protein